MASEERCEVCDRPMVRRRHVWVCVACDLIRFDPER